jgi:hypothetical protein
MVGTWTYCTPEGGAADPERCCLKSAVPAEVAAATHLDGLAAARVVAVVREPAAAAVPGADVGLAAGDELPSMHAAAQLA